MSNSIAPGSSADVNVKVTALTTNPNVPVTYKTIILKKNLVNGVNTLTQEMMAIQNIKYVIKYNYVLGEDITIPANCILEFDGGSIAGNHAINFRNCLNKKIYYSWFGEFATCNNSIRYMDYKQLVIDKDIDIYEPFLIPQTNFATEAVVITGEIDGVCPVPTITAHGCCCIDCRSHFTKISNLFLIVNGEKDKTVSCIKFTTSGYQRLNDIDCVVSNCRFLGEYGNYAIICYGRGLTVENCITLTNGFLFYPLDEPDYPSGNGAYHDEFSGLRDIIIRNNRLHSNGDAVLVQLAANEDCPDWGFNGAIISDNIVDADGYLCIITAKNYGTTIKGNKAYARRSTTSAISISTAYDMLISDNILGCLPWGQMIEKFMVDILIATTSDIYSYVPLSSSAGNELKSIAICNNFLGSYDWAIKVLSCPNGISSLLVTNNILSKNGLTRDPSALVGDRSIVYISNTNARDINISDNILPIEHYHVPHAVMLIKTATVDTMEVENLLVCNNLNLEYNNGTNDTSYNAIYVSEGITLTNARQILPFMYGDTANRKRMKPFDAGISYYDTTIKTPLFWDGEKYRDANGVSVDTKYSGTFAQKPTTDIGIGFKYFCTSGASIDGGTTEKTNIPIFWTGSEWVDANGNNVVAKS